MVVRRRILIPMILLTIGCSVAVLVSSIFLFDREQNYALNNKINVAAMVTEHEINNLKANARVAALGMAINPDLKEAVANNDREKILSTATALQALAGVDYCTILNGRGLVLARTHEPGIYGDSLTHLPHIKQAQAGNVESYVARGVTVRIGAYAGAPIYDGNTSLVGIVSLGFRLDSQKFVEELRAITGCEISVFLHGERISSTISNADGPYALGKKLADEVNEKVLAGTPHIGRVNPLGKDAIAKYIPIHGADNEAAGIIGVSYYTAENANKMRLFIVSGALITLILLAACVIIARFISIAIERRLASMTNENKLKNTAINSLESILNSIDANIYATDPQTDEILFMNDTMRRHYGIEGDCAGQICYKVLQDGFDKRCDFCPCFQLDEDPGKTVVWEERSTLTGRIYRNVDRYIDWPSGQQVHLQHSVDMTELTSAKEAAEQSSRSKGIFLAQMSHEIRTPMNAILGAAEIQLQNKAMALAPETEEALSVIYDSGNLLLNIINDVLDLSKIESGKLELMPVMYDIPSLINDTMQLNLMRYESKSIEFILRLDENTPHDMFGDELRIKQILNNLLSNAFKYTDSGRVELSVAAEVENPERALAAEKDARAGCVLILRVADTGQGMTKEQIDKLFEDFTRFNTDKNRTTIGTGLGMSITKRLVSLMNGEIFVESEPGKGTVFTVRLPQERVGSAVCGAGLAEKLRQHRFRSTAKTTKTQAIREHMPYGSVLIVDDVESNLYVAKGLLSPYGLKIETVTSGIEAVEKIRNGNVYDIVFMDHMMPEMNGMEATEKIRGMGYRRPIVALTANAVVGQAEVFLANGFDGFISKPIDIRQLNATLNCFVRDRHPECARQERERNEIKPAPKEPVDPELVRIAMKDIKNAVAALEDMLPRLNTLNDADVKQFTITVHGTKSALANIRETELSAAALRLEQAGREGNIAAISAGTPPFLNEIRALVGKVNL